MATGTLKYVPTPALLEEDQCIKYEKQKFSLILPICTHKNKKDSIPDIEFKMQYLSKWSRQNNICQILETHSYHQDVNRIEFGSVLVFYRISEFT